VDTVKAKEFVEEWMPKIHIDRAFQRRACWSRETCRKFILAASQNRAPYPVVVADVRSGISECKKTFQPESERKYREVSDSGMDYISLDGQNRSRAFERLFNDELELFGKFVDNENRTHIVENKVFSALPPRLQDKLKDIPVTVFVMKRLNYGQLHDTFCDLNSGDSLNRQEKRNAILTWISQYVRQQALNYSGISDSETKGSNWEMIYGFKESDYHRSMDCEWTAKAYMATILDSNWSLNAFDIDRFYAQGRNKNRSNVTDYSVQNCTRFHSILEKTKTMIASQKIHKKGKFPQKEWWLSLYVAERILVDEQTYVDSYSELFSIIHRIDKALIRESDKKKAADIEEWESNGKIVEEEPKRTDYYSQWASMAKNSSDRKKRKQKFFDTLYKDEEFLALIERSNRNVA